MCTPVADVGFLVDFPVRVLFKFKMIWSELIVWAIAISVVVYNFIFDRAIFDKIEILRLFKHVLLNPWPMWTIILVSAIGTFLSIYLADQVFALVRAHTHHRHIRRLQLKRFGVEAAIFVVVMILYAAMLDMSHLSV